VTSAGRSISVRPHVGQEIIVGSLSYKLRALRSSLAALISWIGSAVSEMRIVSPMPWRSKCPRAIALRVTPGISGPASVTPRWIGYWVFLRFSFAWRSSFAWIVVSTSVDLIEIVRFWRFADGKRIFSKNFTHVIADSVRAWAVGPPCLSIRRVSSEPELTPILIETFFLFASFAILIRASLSAMFPGLIRILSAPLLIAEIARAGLK